ncbi:MAG: hypothetical protein HY721_03510, partial [Planctomycetes bacterium]|nr:hypothetical protein [Planctomycetota bacterium]
MPRFNYQTLVVRQGSLEGEHKKLANRLERVEASSSMEGEEGRRRAAILRTVDAIPDLLGSLHEQLNGYSDRAAEILMRIEDLTQRVRALEEQVATPPQAVPEAALQPGELAPQVTTPRTEPIELAPKLRAKADRFSTRGLAEGGFEEFVTYAVEAELLPTSLASLGPEVRDGLEQLFSLYKATVGLINQAERVAVQELVEAATDAGTHVELPLTADEDTLRRFSVSGKGIFHLRRSDELGVQRIYRFPLEEFPQLAWLPTAALRPNTTGLVAYPKANSMCFPPSHGTRTRVLP